MHADGQNFNLQLIIKDATRNSFVAVVCGTHAVKECWNTYTFEEALSESLPKVARKPQDRVENKYKT